MAQAVTCCVDAQSVRRVGASAASPRTATVVIHVRALALPSMFPAALQQAVSVLPYPVTCAVAPPEAVVAYGPCALGDSVVVVGGQKMGLVPAEAPDLVSAVFGLLAASVGSGLGRDPGTNWDNDEAADPFELLGVSPCAPFEQVRAAWRARLAEYHPDKYAQAGSKIRTLAADESRRLNAAYARIAAAAKNKPLREV